MQLVRSRMNRNCNNSSSLREGVDILRINNNNNNRGTLQHSSRTNRLWWMGSLHSLMGSSSSSSSSNSNSHIKLMLLLLILI
jgi:hypothetical protein